MENTKIEKTNKIEEPIEEKTNKTPYWTMRAASGVIDTGLLIFLMFILISLFRLTPLGDQVNGYRYEMATIQKDYALKPLVVGSEETYGYKVYIDDTNKDKYSNMITFEDEDNKTYIIQVNQTKDKELLQKMKDAMDKAIKADKKYEAAHFNYRLVNYGINMISVSVAEAILILIIPLVNKRRCTIGQYIGGIRLVNNKLPTPARWWKIVIRYFWVVIIEVALPCLSFLSMYAIIVVPLILYLISLFNKNKRTLREYVTSTRFIDSKSYEPIGGHHEDVVDAEVIEEEKGKEK